MPTNGLIAPDAPEENPHLLTEIVPEVMWPEPVVTAIPPELPLLLNDDGRAEGKSSCGARVRASRRQRYLRHWLWQLIQQ